MAVAMVGNGGTVAEVDTNRNFFNRRAARSAWATGGMFSVAGGPSAIVAAALAANTPLMTMRHGAAATTNVMISRLKFSINSATVGASAGVPGQIAWQKFTTATPSGGTARTPAKKDAATAATQVADVRDSNAALTVTSVVFTDIWAVHPIPNFTVGTSNEYVIDLDEDEFFVLQAGDGIALRTAVAAPATMTWTFTYGIHWHEI